MQAQDKLKRFPSNARVSIRKGTARRPSVCKRGNKGTGINASTLNRFRSITFAPIVCTTVIFKQSGNKIFDQLFACYSRYHFLITGQPAEPIDSSDINDINAEFQKLIGDAKLNIEKHDAEDFFFYAIYQEAKGEYGWYTFDVKLILIHLKRENEILHHLFVVFLKCFATHTGIDFWYDYGMEHAIDWFEEQFEDFKAEYADEPDEVKVYQDVLDDYKTGLAAEYEKRIREACDWAPRELINEILSQQIDHPLIDVMVKGCELAAEGLNLGSFDYNPESNLDDGEEALMFPSSFNIIWHWDDQVTEMHRQWLDDTSGNCGVIDPYKWCIVKPDSNNIYNPAGLDWPLRMQEYFIHVNQEIDKILLKKNEQDDTIPAKQLPAIS